MQKKLVIYFFLLIAAFVVVLSSTSVLGNIGSDPNYPTRIKALLEEVDSLLEEVQGSENSEGLLEEIIELSKKVNCDEIYSMCIQKGTTNVDILMGAIAPAKDCRPINVEDKYMGSFWEKTEVGYSRDEEDFTTKQEELQIKKERLSFLHNIIKKEMGEDTSSISLELERMREEGREDVADEIEKRLGVLLYVLDPNDEEVNEVISEEARSEGEASLDGDKGLLEIINDVSVLIPTIEECESGCILEDWDENLCIEVGAKQEDFIMTFGINITFEEIIIPDIEIKEFEISFSPKINLPDPRVSFDIPLPDINIRFPQTPIAQIGGSGELGIEMDPIIVPSPKIPGFSTSSIHFDCPDYDYNLLDDDSYGGTHRYDRRVDTVTLDWVIQMFDYLATSCREMPPYLVAERKCNTLFQGMDDYGTAKDECDVLGEKWREYPETLTESDVEKITTTCTDIAIMEDTFEKCRNPEDEDMEEACFYVNRKLEKGDYHLACIAALEQRVSGGKIDAVVEDFCSSEEGYEGLSQDLKDGIGELCTKIHEMSEEDLGEEGSPGRFVDNQTLVEEECFSTETVISRIKKDCRYIWERYTETWMFLSLFREMYKREVLFETEESYENWICIMDHLSSYRLEAGGSTFFQSFSWWRNNTHLVFFPRNVCGNSAEVISTVQEYRNNPDAWEQGFGEGEYLNWYSAVRAEENVITFIEMLERHWYEFPLTTHYQNDELGRDEFLQHIRAFRSFIDITDDWILVFDFIDAEKIWLEFLQHINTRGEWDYIPNSWRERVCISPDPDRDGMCSAWETQRRSTTRSEPGKTGLYIFYEFLEDQNLIVEFEEYIETDPNLKKILLPPKICQQVGIEPVLDVEQIEIIDESWQEYIMREQYTENWIREFQRRLDAKNYKINESDDDSAEVNALISMSPFVTFFNSYGTFLFLWENELIGEKSVNYPFNDIYSSDLGIPESYERCRAEGGLSEECEPLKFDQYQYMDEQSYLFDSLAKNDSDFEHEEEERFLEFIREYERFVEYSEFLNLWEKYPRLLIDENVFNEYSDYANNWEDYKNFLDDNDLWDDFNNYARGGSFENNFASYLVNRWKLTSFSEYIAENNKELFYDIFDFFIGEKNMEEDFHNFLRREDDFYLYKYLEFLGRHDEWKMRRLVNMYTFVYTEVDDEGRVILEERRIIDDPLEVWYEYYQNGSYYTYNGGKVVLELPYEKNPPFLPFSDNLSDSVTDSVCQTFVDKLESSYPGGDYENYAEAYMILDIDAEYNEDDDEDYPESLEDIDDLTEICRSIWNNQKKYSELIADNVNSEWERITIKSDDLILALRQHSGNSHKVALKLFLQFLTLNNLTEEFLWDASHAWYYLYLNDAFLFLEERGLFDYFVKYVEGASPNPATHPSTGERINTALVQYKAPPALRPFTINENTPLLARAGYDDINRNLGPEFEELKILTINDNGLDYKDAQGETIWEELLTSKVYDDYRWSMYEWFHLRMQLDMMSVYRKLSTFEYRWPHSTTIKEFRSLDLYSKKTRDAPTTGDKWKATAILAATYSLAPAGQFIITHLGIGDLLDGFKIFNKIASWFATRYANIHPDQPHFLRQIIVLKKLIPVFTEERSSERVCEYLFLSRGSTSDHDTLLSMFGCVDNPINTAEDECGRLLEEEIRRKEDNILRVNFPHHCAILAVINENGAQANLLNGYSDKVGGNLIDTGEKMAPPNVSSVGAYSAHGMPGCTSRPLGYDPGNPPDDVPDITVPQIPLSRFNVEIDDIETPDLSFGPIMEVKTPNFYFEDLIFPDVEICDLSQCQQFLNLFPSLFEMFPDMSNLHLPMPPTTTNAIELDKATVDVEGYGTIQVPLPKVQIEEIEIPSFSFTLPQLKDVNVFSFATPLYEMPDPGEIEITEPEIEFIFKGIDIDVMGVLINLIMSYFGIDVGSYSGCMVSPKWSIIPIKVVYEDYYISWPDFPSVPEIPMCRTANSFCRNAKDYLEDITDSFDEFIEKVEEGIKETLRLPLEAKEVLEEMVNEKLEEKEEEINNWLGSNTFTGRVENDRIVIDPINISLGDIRIEFNLSELYDGNYINEVEIEDANITIELSEPILIEMPTIPLDSLDMEIVYDIELPGFQSIDIDIDIMADSQCSQRKYEEGDPFEISIEDEYWDIFSEQNEAIKNSIRNILY